jgi:hypothetical protein
MSTTAKVLYKPLSLATSVLGGILAGMVFRQVWARIGTDDTAPVAGDLRYSTREVLAAAAIQGAVFGLVKAGVDRAGARSYRAITHEDPL